MFDCLYKKKDIKSYFINILSLAHFSNYRNGPFAYTLYLFIFFFQLKFNTFTIL